MGFSWLEQLPGHAIAFSGAQARQKTIWVFFIDEQAEAAQSGEKQRETAQII